MKRCIWKLTLLLLAVIFLSCSSSPGKETRPQSPTQPRLSCPYKPEAIKLVLRADPQLHFSDNVPHTLHLCIYQLKDPNAFNLKAKFEEGLYELLDCSSFDPSVTDFERVIVYPGQDQTLNMNRAEGSNYIAFAAGYNNMQKDRIIRFHEIPVETKTKMLTPWKKYYVCRDLNLEIMLGPEQIEKIEVYK